MRTSIAFCLALVSSVVAGAVGALLVSAWKEPPPQQDGSPLDVVMLNDISNKLTALEQDIAELRAQGLSHADTRLLSSVDWPDLAGDDSNAVILGDANAEFFVVEFSDYFCSFCKRYNERNFAEVRRAVESAKGAYIALDLPLSRNEQPVNNADLSYCAYRLGDYLTFRDAAFGRPDQIRSKAWDKIIARTSIDAAGFDACLKTRASDDGDALITDLAQRLGVRGTPSFFVARRAGAGKADGVLIEGRMSESDLEMAMREL